jgi:hypothetical protein
MDGDERKRPSKKNQVVVICILGVFIVSIVGLVGYKSWTSYNPIPKNIRQSVSYPLYYPEKLPPGWSINTSSFLSDAGVVIYVIEGHSKSLHLTIQKRPENFDFKKFYEKSLTQSFQFAAPLGQGGIGKSQGRLIGSLVTGSSWVLVTSISKNINQDDIYFILSHLKQS